jgi:hypothetical protein
MAWSPSTADTGFYMFGTRGSIYPRSVAEKYKFMAEITGTPYSVTFIESLNVQRDDNFWGTRSEGTLLTAGTGAAGSNTLFSAPDAAVTSVTVGNLVIAGG